MMYCNIDCSFCSELNGDMDNNYFQLYLKTDFLNAGLSSRVISETGNFVLMPMVGPLVPGYLLIVPKNHYLSYSHMTNHLLEEVIEIKSVVSDIFEKVYCKPVFFEHGAMSHKLKGGCCSDHAHLHAVAVEVDVKDKFEKFGFEKRLLTNYLNVTEQQKKGMPYLYYENQAGEMFIADAPIAEGQFIRKLIATEINAKDRALWNKNIQINWMIENISKLKPYFEAIRGKGIWK